MTRVIEAHDLSKAYGDVQAVDHVTLAVEKGALFGLLGPNGSGKTTMIKMLTGQTRPSGGTASVLGIDVIEGPGRDPRTGRDHPRAGDPAQFPHLPGVPEICCSGPEDPGYREEGGLVVRFP